ncbi:DUF6542 domain-containing protein [Mycobacterium sp. AMU20-3851]|uniref:DUF6542 domain-containing protein n=1 Tax=Mycobacterium sp. AMU20-3851 TaxID=3122055 RepID=UPI0037553DCF
MTRRSAPTPESGARRSVLTDAQTLFAGLPDRLPVKIPWWGATLLAVTLTAVGFAYDAGAGNGELGAVFSTFYVLGCLLAVVLVQRPGLFTAMIQPPLILFVAVPTAYFLFHSSQIDGLKDILINCGYPLIERFPLMFFTSAVVLLLGAARWYLLRGVPESTDEGAAPTASPRRAARRFARTDDPAEESERPRAARRPRRDTAEPADRPRRSPRTGTPSRARHNRPPESDIAASAAAADRRERAAARERSGRPRRHPESPADPTRHSRRRDSRDQRDPREPRRRGYDSAYGAQFEAPDSYERPRRRPRPDGYESRFEESRFEPGHSPRPDDRYADPYAERPRRPAPDPSHHPVSRVRYRSSGDEPRNSHRRDADFWDSEN